MIPKKGGVADRRGIKFSGNPSRSLRESLCPHNPRCVGVCSIPGRIVPRTPNDGDLLPENDIPDEKTRK